MERVFAALESDLGMAIVFLLVFAAMLWRIG